MCDCIAFKQRGEKVMKKLLLVLSVLFLTACNTAVTYSGNKEKITINHEQDNITTVSISAEYPLGEVHDAETIRTDYIKVLNNIYGENSVKDVKVTIQDNKVMSVTVLDFRTIKDLTVFGITSKYPSLREFEQFLQKSGFTRKG